MKQFEIVLVCGSVQTYTKAGMETCDPTCIYLSFEIYMYIIYSALSGYKINIFHLKLDNTTKQLGGNATC